MNLQYQYLIDLSTAICMFVVIFIFLILFEARCSKKIFLASLIPFLILWVGGNLYILVVYGLEVQGKYTLLTATLPSLIYFFIVAKNRGGRFFFTFCLCDTVMIWVMMTTGLIDYAVGGEGLVNFILRMIAFPVLLYVVWRFARKPYLSLMNTVSSGWWLFAGMTGLFYLTLSIMGGIPTNLRLRPDDMPAAVMMLILLPLTYLTIFIVIYQQDELFHVRERQRVFEAQANMMSRRVDEIRRTAETIRIERHDMRHQLLTVAAFAKQGDLEGLLEYVGAAQANLDTTKIPVYCQNPIIDAVLSSAAEQAREAGAALELAVALPKELTVEPLELSIVFANALENAIQAVKELPKDQRRIICKSVTHPRLIVEIANPYAGKVHFDRQGLPVTHTPGHGIGTRSIMAFADKYNALCQFRAENGWFKVQLAV